MPFHLGRWSRWSGARPVKWQAGPFKDKQAERAAGWVKVKTVGAVESIFRVPSGGLLGYGMGAQAFNSTVGNLEEGAVRVQGRDGRWRDPDSVPPGNDPTPPRD